MNQAAGVGLLDDAAAHDSGVLVIARLLPIVFAGLMPGFLLGLFTFRVKSRWCPRCGETTEAIHRSLHR
ncbi:hypothetical protein [Micromonospora sp. NBC_01813]|uniref:hypothetical protein n=1 Tax=Micromonospora sp. NBC_01813 TaxID=2975988 RepID=UPI002DD84EEF|nr:hypothetical protein [Micromonospora sp. NBC_01813]WSA10882.1 hypothetical protein OG958_08950 [Micromonospora sp. NBC_01813]